MVAASAGGGGGDARRRGDARLNSHAPPPPKNQNTHLQKQNTTGDKIHLVHVINPGKQLVMTPDLLGVEGVIEDDPATKQRVVSVRVVCRRRALSSWEDKQT